VERADKITAGDFRFRVYKVSGLWVQIKEVVIVRTLRGGLVEICKEVRGGC